MILVPLLNPKFATVPAEKSCELRVRGTSNSMIPVPLLNPKFARVPAGTQLNGA
jgi:hypothetical protein